MKLKIEIKNRWNGKIIFEFETEGNTMAKTIAEYVRQCRANLSRANLSDADLDSIKYDFFGRMLMQKKEIPALREKLIAGEVDGSCYEGKCACFVGTIANIKEVGYMDLQLKPNAYSATEIWFAGINQGDTPENNTTAKITLGWIDEFLLLIA